MGSILDEARKDWNRITTSGGFEVDITLEALDVPDPTTVVVKGIHSLRSMEFDFEAGAFIRADKAHATISIQVLVDAGYPYRDANGAINMLKHKLSFLSSEGLTKNFKISENFPDETVGIITFNLVAYGVN